MNLAVELNAVLDRHAIAICEDIEREWGNQSQEGRAEVHQVTDMLASAIQTSIIASGQKAWILEYGKGSLMDLDNPYLDEYKASDNYNPYRKYNEIAGRPAGEYYDLDGNIHYSSGKAIGRNLEKIGKEEYRASEPLHLIHEAIQEQIPFILEEIIEVCMLYSIEQITNAFPKEIII